MAAEPRADTTIESLIRWGAARDSIRAMLLTSTRARPGARLDRFSDYDVILVASDVAPLVTDRSWLADFGEVLVAYWDPVETHPSFGIAPAGNVTYYADGLKIDFTFWPAALLAQIAADAELPAELDAGYRVLLDKDGVAAALPAPTFKGYAPRPPSLETYRTHINDFLTEAPYIAKCLWRNELMPAKWCLDREMKYTYLLPVLEWRVGLASGWSTPVGVLGRGMRALLPADIWAQLERLYAGPGLAENWTALERSLALFRQVATEVGAGLGYAYPDALHERVLAYVDAIRRLPPGEPAGPAPADSGAESLA